MRTLHIHRLPPVCERARERRSGHQSVPARRRCNSRCARQAAGSRAASGRSALRQRAHASARRVDRRDRMHRLHEMHSGLPGRCDRRRVPLHAHGHRCAVHRLRAVHSALPGRLHRDASPALAVRADAMATMPGRARRTATRCSQGALDRAGRCAPRARSNKLVLPLDQHAGAPAVPLVKPGERVLLRPADCASPAAQSARGCIRRSRERSQRSSRGRRRIACGAPALSIVIANDGRDERYAAACADSRSISSRPSSCASIIAPRRHRRAGRRGISDRGEAEQRAPERRLATAAQRRRMRALHQLRRHADARASRAMSCSVHGFCCTRSAAKTASSRSRTTCRRPRSALRWRDRRLRTTSAFALQRVPSIYPAGGERQLITAIFGVEVPSGGLPADIGIPSARTSAPQPRSRTGFATASR